MPRRRENKPQRYSAFDSIRLEIVREMVSYGNPEQIGTATATAANLRATVEKDAHRFREAWVRLARL